MDSDSSSSDFADAALKLFAEAAAKVSQQEKSQPQEPTLSASLSNADEEQTSGAMTDVEKKRRERRLMMNRITARERRKRKRELIDELQETVKTLTARNDSLTETNRSMKKRLIRLEAKTRNCSCQQTNISGESEQCRDGETSCSRSLSSEASSKVSLQKTIISILPSNRP
mmetsp:Transcript_24155/g.35430  ORF Transcript_24155/g.35430 Transcript_24155/m.35430 type:complete len:171 (+) Transcript_24155:85-597(+)